MDLKNLIDTISIPKNIGTNKWVVNNFGDLKTSNDYLHVLRLRYDNRWLKTYWDLKLKEIEKEHNFYTTTPLKKKKLKLTNNIIKDYSSFSSTLPFTNDDSTLTSIKKYESYCVDGISIKGKLQPVQNYLFKGFLKKNPFNKDIMSVGYNKNKGLNVEIFDFMDKLPNYIKLVHNTDLFKQQINLQNRPVLLGYIDMYIKRFGFKNNSNIVDLYLNNYSFNKSFYIKNIKIKHIIHMQELVVM